ncbi:hypothetical protein [Nocardia brasiliensis]|uniref:hypothetical protein n=1 Tax=Nocardia brasiliensis TaxID=37326 RepID=UPI003D7B9B8A
MSAIAAIDLARWRAGGAAAAEVEREVDEGLRRAGFLLVYGHGVPAELAGGGGGAGAPPPRHDGGPGGGGRPRIIGVAGICVAFCGPLGRGLPAPLAAGGPRRPSRR